MKRSSFAAIALAALLGGCDLVPGSGAYRENQARAAAAQLLIDPASAQFRNVADRDGAVCGEINGKNRMGAYVGFTRFYVDTARWEAALDPQHDYSRLASARRLCASIGGSSCDDEAEEEIKRLDQQVFDGLWDARCRGSAARGSRATQPWDPTSLNASVPEENWVEQSPPVENAAKPASDAAESSEDLMGDVDGVDALAGTDANLSSAADLENASMEED